MKRKGWMWLAGGVVVIAATLGWMEWRGRQIPPADQPTARIRLLGVIRSPKWMAKHQGMVEQEQAAAKSGGLEILFLGDSITENWRGYGRAVWDKKYAARKVAAWGIGGDGTQHILWRIQNGEFEHVKPQVVVLMAGTNNLTSHTAEEIAAGVAAILAEIRRRSPESKVVLTGVPPRGEEPTGALREKVREVNRRIGLLADGRAVKSVDIGPMLMETDGRLAAGMRDDGVHLSEVGYELWAKALDEALAGWVPEAATTQ